MSLVRKEPYGAIEAKVLVEDEWRPVLLEHRTESTWKAFVEGDDGEPLRLEFVEGGWQVDHSWLAEEDGGK